eukprot:TRINITY_DN26896_c0_g2_i1.p1 TRINITY_DN26896_c0_g2~~TRINITY_DN26896_c0_g2_i1.p1  ORF type:complete len:1082 (-),score=261.34 TRINITY_DN26896_c0_g2_i1:195-3272(-)
MQRTYAMWSTSQTPECFDKSSVLFYDSGSQEHTQWRKLLDEVGFDRMHNKALASAASLMKESWAQKIRGYIGKALPAPTELEVGQITLPLLFEGIWGKKPTSSEVLAILPYLEFGKICIIGARGKSIGVVRPWIIEKARSAAVDFAKDSPTAKALLDLINSPKYAAVKKLLSKSGLPIEQQLLRDVVDASLFAGLLGTTDMTHKCVSKQFQDRHHVLLFRKDPTEYLHELMRYSGAVASITTALHKDEVINLEGHKIGFKKEQPLQHCLATANLDPTVFPDPSHFDPSRPELGKMITWNGKLSDVKARNYSGAPRFCPGYHLSVKIATEVCAQFTVDLNPWGTQRDENVAIKGIVKIKMGHQKGQVGHVAYWDHHKKKHCIQDKDHEDKYLGCFADHELEVVDPDGGRPKTLDEEYAKCPMMLPQMMHMLNSGISSMISAESTVGWAIERLLGKKHYSENFNAAVWSDEYVLLLWSSINLIAMPMYKARHADSVMMPRRTGTVETFEVGTVESPDLDIDHPHYTPIEWYLPQPLFDLAFVPGMSCFHGFLRRLPMEDMYDYGDRNTWEYVMKNAKQAYRRKVDWVMSFYNGYKTMDGEQNWPTQEVNFAKLFLKNDLWEDKLEKAMAFGLIGAHRVEVLETPLQFGGESLPYVIRFNEFAKLPIRPGFGKYEVDMYFTKDGMPALAETADGSKIAKGDKTWQYWKFVWRSVLLTVVTLTDHLHMTHFKAANILATSSRKTLSPDHPLRRLLTIHTFGSIWINMQAMHTLIGSKHMLHRATPFVDFDGLSAVVPTIMKPLPVKHKAFLKEEEYNKLPPILKQAPYFADGKLLFDAEFKMLKSFFKTYAYGEYGLCDKNDMPVTPEFKNFVEELTRENLHAHYNTVAKYNETTCTELQDILMAYIWTVTGWHRHVGTVGDYYRDPELATMGWVEGESSARPYQHMVMSVIAVFTGSKQPKLIEDYSHIFKGMEKEEEMLKIHENFREDLHAVSEEVQRRNSQRLKNSDMGYQKVHADPRIVECSVAV